MINPYKILSIHAQMTDMEVRAAYRTLARHHHPDRPGGNVSAFAGVTEAYAAVGTAKARASTRAAHALVAPLCGQCSGDGCMRITKGFTSTETRQCDICEGAGYVLGQTAVRSYQRKKKV